MLDDFVSEDEVRENLQRRREIRARIRELERIEEDDQGEAEEALETLLNDVVDQVEEDVDREVIDNEVEVDPEIALEEDSLDSWATDIGERDTG